MAETPKSIGSLPVPSVQAFAADINGSAYIPERYIRPESEADPVLSFHDDLEIPVIDMSLLLDPESTAQESAKLHLACQDWGFFQLINHKIPSEAIERMKVDVTKFFKLPSEKKKAFSQAPGDLEGYGQLFVVSEDQKLDWADVLNFNTQPLKQRRIHLWPTEPPTFKDTFDRYTSEVYLVAHTLLSFMAKNLGVNPEVINSMLTDGMQSVRMNYYPPCSQPDKVLGISPHSDGALLTLVLQINQVQGLQIKKNGGWVPIKPLPGALVANIGDRLEILSNGMYRSIEHRATVNKEKERISVAAFHSPSFNSIIGPLPEIVRDQEAKYKTINHEDFIKHFYSAKLDGKSSLDRMKLHK